MAAWKCFSVALVALLALAPSAMAQANTTATPDCEDKLDELIERYENSTAAVTGCDATCVKNCYATLEAAFEISTSANPDVSSCPSQASIITCFKVFETEWKAYAAECAVTSVIEEMHEEADVEAEAAEAEAEAEAPSPAEAEIEEEEGGAAISSPAEAEADEEGEAAAPAPAEAESEAGRRLMADAEAESEAESESESGASSASCFPTIDTAEDFEKYLSGELALAAAAAATSGAATARVALGAAAAALALAAF